MQPSVLQVVDSVEAEASGPSYTVPRLCEALAQQGADVRLLTLGSARLDIQGWRHDPYQADFASIPVLSRLRLSSQLAEELRRAAPGADVLHTNGLWLMPNVYPAWAARAAGKPFVFSPRGMLGEPALRFSAWRKRLVWILLQGRAAHSAHCIHATSAQERDEIRAFGLTAPIAVIPNGVDLGAASKPPRPPGAPRSLLYLGRIHPKKGLESLVAAWAKVAHRHPNWSLDIVGPLDSFYARDLAQSCGSAPRLTFRGALYAGAKTEAYRSADLFVLPTLNENFAMTVAEALAQGTPVISTRGAPWSGLETHGCGWWIEHDVGPLEAALDRAMALQPDTLASMGAAGRAWMSRDFGWNAIAASMADVYKWLAGRAPRPACVMVD